MDNQSIADQAAKDEGGSTTTEEADATKETPTEGTETPVSQDTETEEGKEDTPSEESASDEGTEESEDEENIELSDEEVNAFAEAYSDRISSSESFKTTIAEQIQSQVDTRMREQTRLVEGQSEVDTLIEQGKQAVNSMAQLAEKANAELTRVGGELAKAGKDEEFDANISEVFKPDAFLQHLSNYGQAVVAEVTRRHEDALYGAIEDASGKLPKATPDQEQKVLQIVDTANRMKNDPKQQGQAETYFASAMLTHIFDRALSLGAEQEQGQRTKRSTVSKKVAQTNTVKKAAAKLAKDRGDLPPKTPTDQTKPTGGPPSGSYDSVYYRGLKKEGKTEDAQNYVDSFGRGKVTL